MISDHFVADIGENAGIGGGNNPDAESPDPRPGRPSGSACSRRPCLTVAGSADLESHYTTQAGRPRGSLAVTAANRDSDLSSLQAGRRPRAVPGQPGAALSRAPNFKLSSESVTSHPSRSCLGIRAPSRPPPGQPRPGPSFTRVEPGRAAANFFIEDLNHCLKP
jgi:hypothetical protein